MSKKSYSFMELLPATFSSVLFICQIIFGIYFLSEVTQIEFFAYIGACLYIFSGFVFGMLPTIEFRKKGEVKKGKSYIHTTKIVDTGIYSIVRHPQYVSFIMFAISGILLFQHWVVIILGIPIIPLTYVDLLRADRQLIKKFGDDYIQYMKKVPRANFIVGLFRLFREKK
jgi:protein-S-isoprenylcysteine O-methyltransferase Ste14